MRRRQRYTYPPKKSAISYLLPFLVIFALGILIYYGYLFLTGNDKGIFLKEQPEAFLYIENGSAEVLLWGKDTWHAANNGMKVFQGDAIKMDPNSRGKIQLFDQSILRLDERGRIVLTRLQSNSDQKNIGIALEEGNLWAKIETVKDPSSTVELRTEHLKISTKGASFSLSEDSVRVFTGKVLLFMMDNENILQTIEVGIGQEVVATEESIQKLRDYEDIDLLAGISDDFKKSEWYRWNRRKDNAIVSYEEPNIDVDTGKDDEPEAVDKEKNEEKIVITSPKFDDSSVTKKSIEIKGKVTSETITKIEVAGDEAIVKKGAFQLTVTLKEGKNNLVINGYNEQDKTVATKILTVYSDTTPPSEPEVVSPELDKNNKSTIETSVQKIEGTADKDVYKIMVNGYTLAKYVPGSRKWSYFAKTSLGNLEEGENIYKIVAEDKAGNQSNETVFTIKYEKGKDEEKDEDETKDADEDTPDAGQDDESEVKKEVVITIPVLAITEPHGGEDVTTNQKRILIEGTATADVHSVEVSGYTLTAFSPGDTSWKYQASFSIGNLDEGKNKFTVIAYDENDKELLRKSITITYDETPPNTSINAPAVTFPTSTETTLSVINIGGTTDANTQKIYVDGTAISYEAGSTKWKTTVHLEEGINVFKIHAANNSGTKSETIEFRITLTE